MISKFNHIFVTKSGKINTNYKKMIKMGNVDQSIIDWIDQQYTEYDNMFDKIQSIIKGDYRKCANCSKPISWRNYKKKNCSIECSNKSAVKNLKISMLDKYGVESAVHNDQIRTKIEQTCLKRYGTKKPGASETVRNKIKQTNLDRYGVISTLSVDSVREQQRNTRIINDMKQFERLTGIQTDQSTYEQMRLKSGFNYTPDFMAAMYDYVSTRTQPDVDIVYQNLSPNASFLRKKMLGINTPGSSPEEEIVRFIRDDLGLEVITNSRTIIKPYELDIYIPSHKVAIEFNGTYWHCDKHTRMDPNYHQMKTKMCNDIGITLIHIYEHKYHDNISKYRSIIKAKLKQNSRIYARKCVIKLVTQSEEKDFLDAYHLQNYIPSSTCVGLYYGGELVTLCSFGKSRYDKNFDIELLRNCSKSGITVVGGLSKIIKFYKQQINNTDIVCYSDASISYNKGGKLTKPSYVWVRYGYQILSRYQTMKHKLPKLLGDSYNCELSEDANMRNNNYSKLYDSGNYKTVL